MPCQRMIGVERDRLVVEINDHYDQILSTFTGNLNLLADLRFEILRKLLEVK
jgi:hypothetical protein